MGKCRRCGKKRDTVHQFCKDCRLVKRIPEPEPMEKRKVIVRTVTRNLPKVVYREVEVIKEVPVTKEVYLPYPSLQILTDKGRKKNRKAIYRSWVREESNKVFDGKRYPCSECSSWKGVSFHHDEYRLSNPTIGRWLCWECHSRFHHETPADTLPHGLDEE